MSTEPFPLGAHPTDDALLLLSDVTSDDALRELLDELAEDADATTSPSDPFGPEIVTASWKHLGSCSTCTERQESLLGRVHSALVSVPVSESWLVDGADRRIAAASAALVGSPGAAAENLERREPSSTSRVSGQLSRFRWLPGLRRSQSGSSTPSMPSMPSTGRGSTLVRGLPWAAAAAIVLAGGLVLGFRGPASEKGALRSQSADTTAPSLDPNPDVATKPDSSSGVVEAAETEAAAETMDATGAMAAAQDGAPPNAETNPQADAPVRPAPESPSQARSPVTDQPSIAAAPPPPPAPAPVAAASEDQTRTKTAIGPASAPTTTPPTPPNPSTAPVAAKRAPSAAALPSAAASGRAALGSGSTPTPTPTPTPSALGAFPDSQSALDAFARRFGSGSGSGGGGGAPTVVVDAPAMNETNVAPASTRPASAGVVVTTAPVAGLNTVNAPDFVSPVCPNIVGVVRAEAVVNGQQVLIVRALVTDPTGTTATDIVADRGTCGVLTQRVVAP